jgi:pimeloyl-ACP methyl ester carboxylesterase
VSNFLSSCVIAVVLFLPPYCLADAANRIPTGDTTLRFSNWEGPELEVRVFVPNSVSATTPIVIVMHGFSRDIDRYYRDWRPLGAGHEFIVVMPYMSEESFPGSNEYNLGHVFDKKTLRQRPEPQWSYSAIEPLFDVVVKGLGGKQKQYTLYGHSAGSQFVHRFLYYKPGARVRRYIAANAGWYMMPDFSADYPYGLNHSGLGKDVLGAAFSKEMVVLLGKEDTNPDDHDLRKSPEANRQGIHRLERGQNMMKMATSEADKLGKNLNWSLRIVDGVGHNNAAMAKAAAVFIK